MTTGCRHDRAQALALATSGWGGEGGGLEEKTVNRFASHNQLCQTLPGVRWPAHAAGRGRHGRSVPEVELLLFGCQLLPQRVQTVPEQLLIRRTPTHKGCKKNGVEKQQPAQQGDPTASLRVGRPSQEPASTKEVRPAQSTTRGPGRQVSSGIASCQQLEFLTTTNVAG
jgi:hypothetical protein